MKVAIASMVAVLMAVLLVGSSASAAVPQMINYQGKLTDNAGNPQNGTFAMTFRIYDVNTGGTELWSEGQNVDVTNGLFNVLLGSVTPIGLPFDVDYWVETVVGAEVMTPRHRIVSVGYAVEADHAADADLLDGLNSTDFALVGHGHGDLTPSVGDTAYNEGSNTTTYSPLCSLMVNLPAGGNVLVCANGYAYSNVAGDVGNVQIYLDGTDLRYMWRRIATPNPANPIPWSLSRIVPMSGGAHKILVEIRRQSGTGTFDFWWTNLYAIYLGTASMFSSYGPNQSSSGEGRLLSPDSPDNPYSRPVND